MINGGKIVAFGLVLFSSVTDQSWFTFFDSREILSGVN